MDIVVSIANDTSAAAVALLRVRVDEADALLALERAAMATAHITLDAFEIPRYGRTDFPLPVARRLRTLGEHRNRLVHRCRAAGLPID